VKSGLSLCVILDNYHAWHCKNSEVDNMILGYYLLYIARIVKKMNLCECVLNAGNETHEADSGDINKLLFSAIVQSS